MCEYSVCSWWHWVGRCRQCGFAEGSMSLGVNSDVSSMLFPGLSLFLPVVQDVSSASHICHHTIVAAMSPCHNRLTLWIRKPKKLFSKLPDRGVFITAAGESPAHYCFVFCSPSQMSLWFTVPAHFVEAEGHPPYISQCGQRPGVALPSLC